MTEHGDDREYTLAYDDGVITVSVNPSDGDGGNPVISYDGGNPELSYDGGNVVISAVPPADLGSVIRDIAARYKVELIREIDLDDRSLLEVREVASDYDLGIDG